MIEILRKIKNGVCVVTSSHEGKPFGMTIAWCTRVGSDPEMVAISIGKNRKGYGLIKEGKRFALNILGDRHVEIGRHFGLAEGDNLENFKDIEFDRLKTGSPILKDCVGAVDCELHQSIDLGDHELLIGKVVDFAERDGESILFKKEHFP